MKVKNGAISINPNKIEKILKLEPPKSVKEIRMFLGMCSYYRKYMKNFSKRMQPLINLTKKETEFIWTKECWEAFDFAKDILTSAPVLCIPNQQDPFIIAIDFSYDGMGMVFS